MTNVTPINKSPRLSETEVHQAAQNLIDSGEPISSLALLKALGRGSLTTITKYMSTFRNGEKVPAEPGISLFTEIPETLSRSTKLLAIKIWTESQEIANKELENQRELLQQAAKISSDRVKEAELFSDEQAKRLEEMQRIYEQEIEDLRNTLAISNSELKDNISQLNKTTVELEIVKNENNVLKAIVSETKNNINELKSSRDIEITDLRSNNTSKVENMEKLSIENNRLDLQIAKQQISLDLACKRLDEEKQLRSVDVKENKTLREKSSLLEGELSAWKNINLVVRKSNDK